MRIFQHRALRFKGLIVLFIIGGLWKFAPMITNHIYRNIGYQLLNYADKISRDEHQELDFCTTEVIADKNIVAIIEKAIDNLKLAQGATPSDSQTLLLLGRAYCKIGKNNEAIKAYEQYVRIRPENPLGHIELGIVYSRINQTTFAIHEWQLANLSADDFINKYKQDGSNHDFVNPLWYEWGTFLLNYKLDNLTAETHNGIFFIESFAELSFWKPCSWCSSSEGLTITNQGILKIYPKTSVAIVSFWNISIDNYKQLSLRLRGSKDTLVTIEVVIDNSRNRPIAYEAVSEEWNVWNINLTGRYLTQILISANFNSKESAKQYGELYLDWISLNR